jgi:hypothetical protein
MRVRFVGSFGWALAFGTAPEIGMLAMVEILEMRAGLVEF